MPWDSRGGERQAAQRAIMPGEVRMDDGKRPQNFADFCYLLHCDDQLVMMILRVLLFSFAFHLAVCVMCGRGLLQRWGPLTLLYALLNVCRLLALLCFFATDPTCTHRPPPSFFHTTPHTKGQEKEQ